MLRRCFLVSAVLSLAVVCIAADAAQAQLLRGLFERRQERRDNRRGYSDVERGESTSRDSRDSFYSPEIVQPGIDPYANIHMILPNPKARVWFDGTLTRQTGSDRMFYTPTLLPGIHTYTIRVSWMDGDREVNQERTITVARGRTTVVDLTD